MASASAYAGSANGSVSVILLSGDIHTHVLSQLVNWALFVLNFATDVEFSLFSNILRKGNAFLTMAEAGVKEWYSWKTGTLKKIKLLPKLILKNSFR